VQFRVEGRVFYGHKIVLVTWSPKFRAMLSSKVCDGNPPIVHINDIRYHIFQVGQLAIFTFVVNRDLKWFSDETLDGIQA